MVWSYRRSIKIAPGVRLNLSKRGLGYSVGVPGFRITKSANGRISQTKSIPGTGLYERKTISSPKKRLSKNDSDSNLYQHKLGMFKSGEIPDNIKVVKESITVIPKKGWTIFVGLMTLSAIAGNFGKPTADGTSRNDALLFTSIIILYFSYRLYRHIHPRKKLITRYVVEDSATAKLNNLETN